MSPGGTGEPSSVLDVAHKRQNNEAVLSLVGPRYAGKRRRDQAAAQSGKIRLGVPAARGLMWTSAKVRKVYQVCWRWLVGVRTIPIVLTQVCERHPVTAKGGPSSKHTIRPTWQWKPSLHAVCWF
jgi:hypothetical protein